MNDLWPAEFTGSSKTTPPVVILKEQASLLGKKTEGAVTAILVAYSGGQQYNFNFAFEFILISSLLNYQYGLFQVFYGIEFYPAAIRLDVDIFKEFSKMEWPPAELGEPFINVSDKNKLIEALRIILNSEKTKQVIQAIITQSKSSPIL